jgi:hypothetical protein
MQRSEFYRRYREARKVRRLWLSMVEFARERGRKRPGLLSLIGDMREPEYRAAFARHDRLTYPPRRWRYAGNRYLSRVTDKVLP